MSGILTSTVGVTSVFDDIVNSKTRITLSRGGTRSSKTVSHCQMIALWLLDGKINDYTPEDKEGVFSISRRFKADIERTIYKDWKRTIYNLGLNTKFKIIDENKTLKTFAFRDRQVEFIGFDDEDSLRGYAAKHVYLNEMDQMTKAAFDQIAPRTEGKIFGDWNPDDEDIWINTEIEQRRASTKGDVTVLISNYLNNRFLTKAQVEEIEYRRDTDPTWWAAFGMGQYASKRGRIFQFDIVAEVPQGVPLKGYGLDFGYTNSKTALVKCWETDTDIWFEGLLYESGLQNHDIVARLKELIPNRRDYIAADHAEPKAIDFIFNAGFNIHPANKDVEYGISYMKGKRIHLVAGDENLRSNFRNYKWKEDRNGVALNEPIKIDDHYCDAARYIATFKLMAPKNERNFFN